MQGQRARWSGTATPSNCFAVLAGPSRRAAQRRLGAGHGQADWERPTGHWIDAAAPSTSSAAARRARWGHRGELRQRGRCAGFRRNGGKGRALRRGDAGDGRPERRRAARHADVIVRRLVLVAASAAGLGLGAGLLLPRAAAARSRRKIVCRNAPPLPHDPASGLRRWPRGRCRRTRAARCAACTRRAFPAVRAWRWRCSTTVRRSLDSPLHLLLGSAAPSPQPDAASAVRAARSTGRTCAPRPRHWLRRARALQTVHGSAQAGPMRSLRPRRPSPEADTRRRWRSAMARWCGASMRCGPNLCNGGMDVAGGCAARRRVIVAEERATQEARSERVTPPEFGDARLGATRANGVR